MLFSVDTACSTAADCLITEATRKTDEKQSLEFPLGCTELLHVGLLTAFVSATYNAVIICSSSCTIVAAQFQLTVAESA